MPTVLMFVISILMYQPVNMLILVVVQTINISFMLGVNNKSLTPLMIFLIWVGGLLVIFLYLTSLINIINVNNSYIMVMIITLMSFKNLMMSSNTKFINYLDKQMETNQLMLMVIVVMMIYNLNVLINNIKSPVNNEL